LDVTTITAGLLHDALEDTQVTPDDIQKAFGKETSLLVEGVTKIGRVQASSPEKRQAESIRKIILAMTDDLRVIFIKLADRIHNLKTLKFLPENKQRQIAKETLEIYAPIANRLGMGRIKAELEDLSFRYVYPKDFFEVASMVDPKRRPAENELKKIKKDLQKLMNENNIPVEIVYRIKRLYSIFIKIQTQQIDFDHVYDFMALRIITDSVKNCYSALGIIHQKWPHLPHRFSDYIAMPKTNLYQALHTTIITEKKRVFEIQIRTKDMHFLAENGIAAHWKYKEKDSQSIIKEDKRLHWLREMADLYKEQKSSREFLKTLKDNLKPEEVNVFTPKGHVITLPIGASALDFAFRIHSEIGCQTTGAKINGKTVPLKTILKSGDIVEILTSSQAMPRREWLNIAFTSRARHYIKHSLSIQEKKKALALGKKLWTQFLEKQFSVPLSSKTSSLFDTLSQVTGYRIKKPAVLFELVGSGKIILNKKLMEKLISSEGVEIKKSSWIERTVPRTKKTTIKVEAPEKSLVKLGQCCSPIKGEPIVGYITSGRGVTIHSKRCPLVSQNRLKSQRIVAAAWGPSSKGEYKGKLLITCRDAPGVLAELTTMIAKLEGNIIKAEVGPSSPKRSRIKLSLVINDVQHLERIAKKLAGSKRVFSVKRV
jgi:GTP pyrophosphokinase